MMRLSYKSVLNANSVDPDQMLYAAASDLDLHCLTRSISFLNGSVAIGHHWNRFVPKTDLYLVTAGRGSSVGCTST